MRSVCPAIGKAEFDVRWSVLVSAARGLDERGSGWGSDIDASSMSSPENEKLNVDIVGVLVLSEEIYQTEIFELRWPWSVRSFLGCHGIYSI